MLQELESDSDGEGDDELTGNDGEAVEIEAGGEVDTEMTATEADYTLVDPLAFSTANEEEVHVDDGEYDGEYRYDLEDDDIKPPDDV